MNIDEIVGKLLEIKEKYPNLSNNETLKLMELQLMSRVKHG